jgi:hypothetical protein
MMGDFEPQWHTNNDGVHINAGNSKPPVLSRERSRFLVLPGSVHLSQHCQFEDQAGSVALTNTAGLWLKPALSC